MFLRKQPVYVRKSSKLINNSFFFLRVVPRRKGFHMVHGGPLYIMIDVDNTDVGSNGGQRQGDKARVNAHHRGQEAHRMCGINPF